MSQIFYSQVDSNLQKELNARAKAGTVRDTESLNFMLTKIANVELIAYANQDAKDRSDTNKLYTLGGKNVRSGNYLPSGFLFNSNVVNNRTNTYKVPPFITSCAVTMNDHTMGTLNSAAINITIPDPGRDLDFIENIFARPGRAVTLKIAHADSAIITKNSLTESTIQPKVPTTNGNTKLSVVEFDALIISFSISYLTDGTVTLTVHTRGTSNVYTDVSMLTDPTKDTKDKEKDVQLTSDFYATVDTDIKKQLNPSYKNETKIHIASAIVPELPPDVQRNSGEADQFFFRSNQSWDKQERYYIQLGKLIDYLNKFILSKQQALVPSAFIISTDYYCWSNYYEHLVSTDPENILIFDKCKYGINPATNKDRYFFDPKVQFKSAGGTTAYESKFDSADKQYSYPTRMFINMNVIKNILINETTKQTKTMKVGEFLIELSSRINEALGGAIDMQLISHPDNPNYLLFYDANYLGDKKKIKPYNVPMMASKERGTIIRNSFKIEAKLPTSMQGLMYTTANNDNISEEQIAPYMHYMYNNASIVRSTNPADGSITESTIIDPKVAASIETLKQKYKESHENYLLALKIAKQEFGDTKKNDSKQTQLRGALQKYIQYPSPTIKESAEMGSPIYPYDIEFTIDGINGFRYGDVLEFDAIPSKYKNGTTFSVIAVNHNVTTTGEWTTDIKCVMRPHFEE